MSVYSKTSSVRSWDEALEGRPAPPPLINNPNSSGLASSNLKLAMMEPTMAKIPPPSFIQQQQQPSSTSNDGDSFKKVETKLEWFKSLFTSKYFISVLVGIFVLIFLITVQPSFIMKSGKSFENSSPNYTIVLILSGLSSLMVLFLTPFVFSK